MNDSVQQLKAAGVEDAEREVHYLLQYSERQQIPFTSVLARRCTREPFAYITGLQPFWTLNIKVSPAVLIPRPETEHLIETVLEHCTTHSLANAVILDLCTGSGCIPAALASELPHAQFTASDLSPAALEIAAQNLSFAQNRVQLLQGDLFAALPKAKRFDIITANPPYIAEREYEQLSAEVKHEPELALLAPEEGLACLKKIIQDAPEFLHEHGVLILECGLGQATLLCEFAKNFPYQDLRVIKDLAGIDRVLYMKRAKHG